ncbi:unnamed protein product, partial [Symbiodinium necroappetens]
MKPPQFEGGGPMVLVRNTFLDIEDPPDPAGEIVRSKTAPPGSGGAWAEDLDSEEEEEEEEQEASPYGEVAGASPISPGSDDLIDEKDDQICRTVTHEWLEEPVQWGWVGEDAGHLVRDQAGSAPSAAPASGGPVSAPNPVPYQPVQAAEPQPMPQMPQPQMPQMPQGQQMPQQMPQQPMPQQQMQPQQMPQQQMPMQTMVFMPVAMAPAPAPTAPMNGGGGAGPSGPVAPGGGYGAPLPELPVRQPDRGARWPVAGVGPLPVGPMPQNAQNSVIVTDGSSAPNSAMAVSSSGRDSTAPPQPQTLTRAF